MTGERWTMPNRFRRLRSPVAVQFEITYRCNNRCVFCHNPLDDASSDISWELGTKVIDALAEAQVFQCIFTGGEPILHPRAYDFMEYCRAKTLRTAIISNGVALKPHIARLLELGCTAFEISVLGSTPELHDRLVRHPGAFAKAMSSLEELGKAGNVAVNVNATITRKNYHDIGNIYRTSKDHGARSFTVTRFVPTNPDPELTPTAEMLNVVLRDLFAAREEKGMPLRLLTPVPFCAIDPDISLADVSTTMSRCDGGVSWCTITPYATLKPCPCWHIGLGDLKAADCETLWRDDPVRNKIADEEFHPQECRDCSLYRTCGAGCRACARKPDEMDYIAIEGKAGDRLERRAAGS